jgi:hypothetical protein
MRRALRNLLPKASLIAAGLAFFAISLVGPGLRAGGPLAPAPYVLGDSYSEDEFMTPSYSAPLDLALLDIR